MSKIKPLLPGPVAAARQVLAECDVRHPRDIHVEAIAGRCGAVVLYGPAATACGSIVRTARRAVIHVDERFRGTPRGRNTVAHEVGHHRQHDLVDHFAQCDGGDGERALSRRDDEAVRRWVLVEREAKHFATELLMPARWAARICAAPRPTLDDVERLQRTFGTSFQASAIRFLELATAPCAFVRSRGGVVVQSSETEAFPGRIVRGRPVHPRSVAAGLQGTRAGRGGAPTEVAADAWGWTAAGAGGFVEQSIAQGPELGVVTWLYAVA